MKRRSYLIQRSSKKCMAVLTAAAVIAAACFASIPIWFTADPTEEDPIMGRLVLRYFTLLSNLFACLISTIIAGFAVDGVKKKYYMPPHWAVRIQYYGTFCTTFTLLISLCILWPIGGMRAVSGVNFLLHILCPALQLLLFFFAESGIILSRMDMLVCQIPLFGYGALYYIEVFVIGDNNGGWSDFYNVKGTFPLAAAIAVLIVMDLLVVFLLRGAHNRQVALRQEKTRKIISGLFENDRTMLLLEAFGLGTDIGSRLIGDELTVPTGLFRSIAIACPDVSAEELAAAYLKGAFYQLNNEKK